MYKRQVTGTASPEAARGRGFGDRAPQGISTSGASSRILRLEDDTGPENLGPFAKHTRLSKGPEAERQAVAQRETAAGGADVRSASRRALSVHAKREASMLEERQRRIAEFIA